MTLADFEIVPGVVITSNDPKNQGRVKAASPGLFDSNEMSEEDMFWICPFCMIGQQSFSKLEVGAKIWILHNKNNYYEYWYLPMFELNENSPNVTNQSADILMSRSSAGETNQIYYADEDGFNITNGQNKIQLDNGGNLNIKTNSTNIISNNDVIKLTKDESTEYSATLAEPLMNALRDFCNNLQRVAVTAGLNPYTAGLSQPLLNTINKFREEIENFKSNVVKIS